jgi:hypothetical protein
MSGVVDVPSKGISATALTDVGTDTIHVNLRGPVAGGGGGVGGGAGGDGGGEGGEGGEGGAGRQVTFTAKRLGCPTQGSPNVWTDTETLHRWCPMHRAPTFTEASFAEQLPRRKLPVLQLPSGLPKSAKGTVSMTVPASHARKAMPLAFGWYFLSFSRATAHVDALVGGIGEGGGEGGAGAGGTYGHRNSCHEELTTPRGVLSDALTAVKLRSDRRYSHDTVGLSRTLLQAVTAETLALDRLTLCVPIPARY